jgi:hypothetical protein
MAAMKARCEEGATAGLVQHAEHFIIIIITSIIII